MQGKTTERILGMYRKLVLSLCALLLPAVMALAAEPIPAGREQGPQQAKELSGMSIVGNDEAPKSLYIVPWKSSEIGLETSLDMMLNKNAVPVDRDVFKRQLDFYEVSTANRSGG
jgi:hypothetical protein